MLCARRKLTGEIVTAYLASKEHGPFKCPDCGDEVILKTGRRKVNHFLHILLERRSMWHTFFLERTPQF
jgi:competence CoiA-like predicted nuclease